MRLPLLMLLASCGDDAHAYPGWPIDFIDGAKYPVIDIDHSIAILATEATRQLERNLHKRFSESEIRIVFRWRNQEPYAGLYDRARMVVMRLDDCIAGTAFIHEGTHHTEALVRGDTDPAHHQAPYWDAGGIHANANAQVREELCDGALRFAAPEPLPDCAVTW